MASKEETEVQWLRSEVLPKILKKGKFVANYSESRASTFKVNAIEIKFIGVEEAFMLTTCYRATVAFEFEGVPGTRSLVVKKTPNLPEDVFDSINFGALFHNEIETYSVIVPAIEQFTQEEFNVAKHYYGDLQRSFATIVLEDFSVNGWRVASDRYNLSLEHVLVAVKYLANFHGIGYALKHVDRLSFETTTSGLREARYATPVLHPEWELQLKEGIKRIRVATRQFQPEVSDAFLQRLMHLISSYYHYGKQLTAPVEPLATLCHGDYLRNNIAFKYANDKQTPVDAMMFDLQTMRVSSPMMDLTVFLALSVFSEVRHTHFTQIFELYCNELTAVFQKHTKTNTVPEFLSHDTLLKEYIRFLPYSISISSSFLRVLVVPEELPSQEMLMQQRTEQEISEDAMKRGGEEVDRELAHQAKELHDLSVLHGVDIGEGINVTW